MYNKNCWTKYNKQELKKVFEFADNYKKFITENKTEREVISSIIKMAKQRGYVSVDDVKKKGVPLNKGDKIYGCLHNRLLILIQVGARMVVDKGCNILGAHVDSPRFDIKQNPLYQDAGLAFFDTHYYGGINMYQWVNMPYELRGVVVLNDGKKVNVCIGKDEDDPVMFINDLLIHLDKKVTQKPACEFIPAEGVNLLIGSRPLIKDEDVNKSECEDLDFSYDDCAEKNDSISKEGNKAISAYILKLLNDKYGIKECNLASADLEVVPAGSARNCGMDSSMIAGYGHDDRACVYPSAMALFDTPQTEKTRVAIFTDKEEVGSIGSTGMNCRYFENMIAELLELNGEGQGNFLNTRRALSKSSMLSSDVSGAYDPDHKDVFERKNSCFLGDGITFNKYGGARGKSGSNEASAEFCSRVHQIMNENNVTWQTAELGAVDAGGGGTIAHILAEYGMEVIDCGVPVLSMHCPWEVISKADLYECYLGYKAFLKNA